MRTRIDFRIIGFDCSPADITAAIGISPTRVWQKGQRINPKATAVHKENGWELRALMTEETEFAKQLELLLEILEPRLDMIRNLPFSHMCELSCALYMSPESAESTPWVHFDSKSLARLASISCEIDFDIYIT